MVKFENPQHQLKLPSCKIPSHLLLSTEDLLNCLSHFHNISVLRFMCLTLHQVSHVITDLLWNVNSNQRIWNSELYCPSFIFTRGLSSVLGLNFLRPLCSQLNGSVRYIVCSNWFYFALWSIELLTMYRGSFCGELPENLLTPWRSLGHGWRMVSLASYLQFESVQVGTYKL
jgi:hypothetical protein